MEQKSALAGFTALGHDGRLAIFRLLVRRAPAGALAGEIATALHMPPSTLSSHLTLLTSSKLVTAERQGRTIRYRADLGATAGLVRFLVADCCRGRPEICADLLGEVIARAPAACGGGGRRDETAPVATGPERPAKVYNVLFVCSGNSARSIMAEAILRDLGRGRFAVHSAGTAPRSSLNPQAVALLERLNHDVSGLRAKGIAEFQAEDAPAMDFVITVCDAAANEECAPWEGQPITGHWGLPDPVVATGNAALRAQAFNDVYRALYTRISVFAELPMEQLDRIALQRAVDDAACTPRARV